MNYCLRHTMKFVAWCRMLMKGYSYGLSFSGELIDNLLEKGPFPKETMAVFDFKSLFLSKRPKPAANELYNLLLEHTCGEARLPSCLRKICDLIVHRSFFMFNEKFYRHTIDVPIGSPLAEILVELVVQKKEKVVLLWFGSHLKLYRRYVNDILVLWDGSSDNIELLTSPNIV